MTASSPLVSIPQEVLEHIAFFAATENIIGPPSGLLPLLLACHEVHQALSFEVNPYLYARIFIFEFDTRSVFRRLGTHVNSPRVLANELKKRWMYLNQIRARADARLRQAESKCPPYPLIDLLWLAYLMMLENDGRNERQLLDYAEMDAWLIEYWFDDQGASLAIQKILQRAWPIEDETNSIAMWLLWLLIRPSLIRRTITRLPHMPTIVKLTAVAANHYPICRPSWADFFSRPDAMSASRVVTHFSEPCRLHPPVLAPAAILTFLTLALKILTPTLANYTGGYSIQFPASTSTNVRKSEDWDAAWYRCIKADFFDGFSGAYVLGSLEGIWEGVFTYTEFAAYALLLSGGAPSDVEHCFVAHHRQTWKLREYYLADDRESTRRPLGTGDPLKAYFPTGTRLQELSDSVGIQEPGAETPARYWRSSHIKTDDHRVMDIIILGEVLISLRRREPFRQFSKGHSAWGQFKLYGRIRPLDGFVSISKEYVTSDRGRWLYRGYLVGGVDGHITGRWRDTLSPSDRDGYEGCFVMSRRR